MCFNAGKREQFFYNFNYELTISQAPFYPREAVSKGLQVWHFGLVFGAFEITVFIVSPIIGANLNRIGVKVRGMLKPLVNYKDFFSRKH